MGAARRPRQGGLLQIFFGPVVLFLVVVGLVMGVGYWALHGKLDQPVGKDSQKSDPAAAKPPVATSPEAPVKATPAPAQPPVTDADILQRRRHIDLAAGAKESMLLTVYYADRLRDDDTLTPVQIRVPASAARIKATVEQVIAAPTSLKLYSDIPAGTKVQSVNFDAKTGVATVDLSPQAANAEGSNAITTMRAALIYSLTAIPDVKAVQLWVGGRPAVLHGITWDKPLTLADLTQRNQFKIEPLIKFEANP